MSLLQNILFVQGKISLALHFQKFLIPSYYISMFAFFLCHKCFLNIQWDHRKHIISVNLHTSSHIHWNQNLILIPRAPKILHIFPYHYKISKSQIILSIFLPNLHDQIFNGRYLLKQILIEFIYKIIYLEAYFIILILS